MPFDHPHSRRSILRGAALAGVGVLLPTTLRAASPGAVPGGALDRAKAALEQHGGAIPHRDRIGIVDFSRPSANPRFFLVDLAEGKTKAFRVTHGRGSDPGHSGWLRSFSNLPGSSASSRGAYLTGQAYEGQHGRSRRLIGLDPTNDNAEARAIVIHGAWYANDDMIARHGKLGRSEGCLAFGESYLEEIIERLGQGRLIYADKL